MRKLGLSFVSVAAVVLLAACNTGDAGKTEKGKSDVASIAIEEGEYIIPQASEAEASEGDGFLALKVKITNESDKSIDLASDDFMLYDEEDNKISLENFYMSETGIKTLSYEKISAGKSKTGYIIFEVGKDEAYQLHYEPTIYEIDKELDPVVLDVNTGDYEDNSEEAVNAATAYIDEVFLATTNENYNKLVSNDRDAQISAFDSNFTKGLKNAFYYYKVTDDEASSVGKAFKEANGEVAEVTYEVTSYFPDSAEIAIKAEVLLFDEMEDEMDRIEEDFVESNNDLDYEARWEGADKAVVAKLPELFKSSFPAEAESYSDSFKMVLKKKDDKWEIQTKSSYSSYYDYLEEAFRGGLYKN
ncbi:DUF5105 domain-containing protein [Enterococcus larvae]|uniref:DUF5105 domain-containing protein n=1 Tax=Enterococcus larvae TaxID=2794352 RepID=UPI003F2EF656